MQASNCPVRCPGCAHRDLSPSESHEQKQRWLIERLAPWRKQLEPLRTVSEANRIGYRSKVCLAAEWLRTSNENNFSWKFGLRISVFDPKRRRHGLEFIPTMECPVHSPQVTRILDVLSLLLPCPEKFPLVDVLISGGLVTLVLKTAPMSDVSNFKSILKNETMAAAGVQGLFLNFNPSAGRRILSSRGWVKLWGDDFEKMPGLGVELVHGPESFQQLIPSLYSDALQEARSFLGPVPGDAVLDLYCGIGASLCLWKDAGAQILGVELGKDSIRCAGINVGAEHLLEGRVSDRIPQMEQWLSRVKPKRICAFVNPPRLGLGADVAEWLARDCRPVRAAYLSCSAGTLAEDLNIFESNGYRVQRIIPYDFFPRTEHVETLVLLGR